MTNPNKTGKGDGSPDNMTYAQLKEALADSIRTIAQMRTQMETIMKYHVDANGVETNLGSASSSKDHTNAPPPAKDTPPNPRQKGGPRKGEQTDKGKGKGKENGKGKGKGKENKGKGKGNSPPEMGGWTIVGRGKGNEKKRFRPSASGMANDCDKENDENEEPQSDVEEPKRSTTQPQPHRRPRGM